MKVCSLLRGSGVLLLLVSGVVLVGVLVVWVVFVLSSRVSVRVVGWK